MKKTLITLFALAGVAAAETLTFEVERDANAVTFAFDEVTVQEILTMTYTDWSYNGGGNNNVGSWQSPTNAAYQNSFSPDAQLRGNTTDSWTMNFTVTNNTEEEITLTQFTFDAYGINGGGSDKTAEIPVTLTLAGITTNISLAYAGHTTTGTLDLAGDNAITIGANETVSLALTMTARNGYNTYSGITAGSVTYTTPVIPEPTTATLSLLALAGLAARRRRK